MHTKSLRPAGIPAAILAGALATGIAWPALAEGGADVTQLRLENADTEPQNWLSVFQNYSSHGYSGLTQLTPANVGDLKVAFIVPITSALVGTNGSLNLENRPLVDDGMMYVDDAWGGIYKIDVSSGHNGEVVWFADSEMSKDENPRSRGIAMWGNAVYKDLVDGRVVAVDRDSGEFLWDLQIARVDHPDSAGINIPKEGFTAAPLAVEGRILVGQSWGDRATRGWLGSLDAETGEEQWRWYAVPGPGVPGHETWQDDHNAWKTGGAGMWTTGSYDVAQRLTIWGTGQPVPMFDPEYRPGDNLFTNAAVAIDIDEGTLQWHFQYTPNESWDYDENGVHILIDVGGKQTVQHFARSGFYYTLDRTDGSYVNSGQYVDVVNWTAGIDDKTGLPVEYDPSKALQTYIPATRSHRGDDPKTACPTLIGGIRWQPVGYNPNTQTAFGSGSDGCFTMSIGQGSIPLGPDGGINADEGGGNNGRDGDSSYGPLYGGLWSIDATTGQKVANFRYEYENLTGALPTAGGLVFTAWNDGYVTAHDDQSLQPLWRFSTGSPMKAAPISYAVGSKQYVAIIAGGRKGYHAKNFPPNFANARPGGFIVVFSL